MELEFLRNNSLWIQKDTFRVSGKNIATLLSLSYSVIDEDYIPQETDQMSAIIIKETQPSPHLASTSDPSTLTFSFAGPSVSERLLNDSS